MKKIGFVVQQDFLTNHFGVRNYFSTIRDVCAEKYQVDYLVHHISEDGLSWSIVDLVSGGEREENLQGLMFNAETDANFLKYSDFTRFIGKKHVGPQLPSQYFRNIGPDLQPEGYDLIVITNPWVVDFDMRLDAPKVVGLVYDLVANEFALTKDTMDFSWAFKHNRGYKYFMRYCDEIYADSEAAAREFNFFYKTNKCEFFPPFPPYVYKNVVYEGEKKENAMILAAPFDQRKGIEQMPELINGAADLIDTLYIYGMPRCPVEMFNKLFEKLRVKKIHYYPYIGNKDLFALYKKCKVLLFPSLEEGLGIPIIEAQICGCRVITTNKSPMNMLTLDGNYLLNEDSLECNIEEIRKIMKDDIFDYMALSKRAKQKYSYSNILQIIEKIMGI